MSPFFTLERSDPAFEQEGLCYLTVKSNALGRRADVSVFVPTGAAAFQDLPLTILLHGVYGSHWAWTHKAGVHRIAQALVDTGQMRPMVLAMPSDGLFGDGSAYIPHRDADYERWIVEEVPAAVRETIPAVSHHSPLFLSGLSMGGYGALLLGAKYPQRFRAFSGLSSITAFEQMAAFVEDFEALTAAATCRDEVLSWLLQNRAQLPPFRFDCGTEDPLWPFNQTLHASLLLADIPHVYETFPGGHNWDYWAKHIGRSLMFFDAQCKSKAGAEMDIGP